MESNSATGSTLLTTWKATSNHRNI